MFGKRPGRAGIVGGRTVIQRAIAVLRRFGTNAHIYLPGVGMLNGLTAANYLDSAGTTVGTVDQPVGLVLDAAGGLGVELVTNGGFDNGLTDWTVFGSASVVGGSLRAVRLSGVDGGADANISVDVGKTYEAIATVSQVSGTPFAMTIRNAAGGYIHGTTGTSRLVFTPAATGTVRIRVATATTDGTVDFDNISVREVSGIAASQPTTANKSVLKLTNGRYNWLFDSTDLLTATYPAGYESVTVIDARSTGQVTTAGANIVGAYSMGPSVTLYGRMIIKGVVPPSDLALLQGFANRLAGL